MGLVLGVSENEARLKNGVLRVCRIYEEDSVEEDVSRRTCREGYVEECLSKGYLEKDVSS